MSCDCLPAFAERKIGSCSCFRRHMLQDELFNKPSDFCVVLLPPSKYRVGVIISVPSFLFSSLPNGNGPLLSSLSLLSIPKFFKILISSDSFFFSCCKKGWCGVALKGEMWRGQFGPEEMNLVFAVICCIRLTDYLLRKVRLIVNAKQTTQVRATCVP